MVYAGIFTFLVESYPLYAASALAANSFARSSFAAGWPLFGVQMYEVGFPSTPSHPLLPHPLQHPQQTFSPS